MFGRVYRCSRSSRSWWQWFRCNFDFSSGWSHHDGGQSLVCRACATHFVLGGGQSCWGPERGERLQLFVGRGNRSPTGNHVVVDFAISKMVEQEDGVWVLVFDDIPCPKCGKAGVLTQSLRAGERCPKCRSGHIRDEGKCIY